MKKNIVMSLLIAGTIFMAGFCFWKANPTTEAATPETTKNFVDEVYSLYGRYYTNGTFVDVNGNVWNYQTDTIDGEIVYDGIPMYAIMRTNGTIEIEDDIISCTGLDYVTKMLDNFDQQ